MKQPKGFEEQGKEDFVCRLKRSLVATYHSMRGRGEIRVRLPQKEKRAGVATNVYSRKTLEKPKRKVYEFKK